MTLPPALLTDAIHCTCVPHLRQRVKELEEALRKVLADDFTMRWLPYHIAGEIRALLARKERKE